MDTLPFEFKVMLGHLFININRPLEASDFYAIHDKSNALMFITEDNWTYYPPKIDDKHPQYTAQLLLGFRWEQELRKQVSLLKENEEIDSYLVQKAVELVDSISYPKDNTNISKIFHSFNYRGVKDREGKIAKEKAAFEAKLALDKQSKEENGYKKMIDRANKTIKHFNEDMTDRFQASITNNLSAYTQPAWESNPEFQGIYDKIKGLKEEIAKLQALIQPIQQEVDDLYLEDRKKKFDVVGNWLKKQDLSPELSAALVEKIEAKKNEVPKRTGPITRLEWT